MKDLLLRGKPISPGYAQGQAFLLASKGNAAFFGLLDAIHLPLSADFCLELTDNR